MNGAAAGPPLGRLRLIRAAWSASVLQWRAAPVAAPVAMGLTLLGGVLPAVTAWLGKLLIDELTGSHPDPHRAVALALGAAGAGALLVVELQAGGYLSIHVDQRITVSAERKLFARIASFRGLRYFDDPQFHNRVRLAEQAAQTAPQAVSSFLQEVVRCVAAVAGYAGVLLVVWWPMAVLLLVTGVVALLAQLRQAQRHADVYETSAPAFRRWLYYRSLLTEPQGAKEVRVFGLGGLVHGRMVDALTRAGTADLAVRRRGALVQSALGLLNALVTAAGAAVVVDGAARGRFTAGDVALFLAAVAGVQSAFVGIVAQAGSAARGARLFLHFIDLLAAPPDLTSGALAAPPLRHGIEFRDVWFRYEEHGPWVLRGVSFVLPAGQAVGLAGENGSGKSTLVKLLCRFYDPTRGQILWDGTDLRDLDLDDVRRRLGATFQDFLQYDLSAAENIGVGDIDHLDDLSRIRRAAGRAEVDQVLSALPAGYRTLLSRTHEDDDGLGGRTLSGGQWQRVALARSLVREQADVLILDEPSAGMDAAAEYRVHRTLRTRGQGRTRLLITHRMSALRGADTILVIAGGAIVERGTHGELMTADGEYCRLFSLQARDYQDARVGTEG